jgi:probable HAF family extracellular repeat protein
MTDIGELNGRAINAGARIAGTTNLAAVWHRGVLTGLGTLGGNSSTASGINASGQVVGSSSIAGNEDIRHAFVWYNGVMTDLGSIGTGHSEGLGINAAGQVVGLFIAGSSDTRPFVWQSGIVSELPTLGGGVSEARGINAAGWIVGNSRTLTDETHATLWMPQ